MGKLEPTDFFQMQELSEKNKLLYPQEGMAKRIFSGSFFIVLGQGIDFLKHILLVPLFLRAWGQVVYGEWLSIYAMVAYLSMADAGMQIYIVNRLTQESGKGDRKRRAEIFQSALMIYFVIILVAALLFLIFVICAPLNDWLNITQTDLVTTKLTAIILGDYLLISIMVGLITGLYTALGEHSRRAMLADLKELSLLSLLASALFLRGGFAMTSLLHFIPLLCLVLYSIWDIRRRYPEIPFKFSLGNWKLSLSFVGPGLLFLMITLAQTLKIQGSILVIGNIIGAGAVVVFSIHRTLAHLTSKFIGAIKNVIWPELTVADSRQNFQKMKITHNLLIKFSLFVSCSFAILLFFTGENIIEAWTQGKIIFHPTLWLIWLLYLPLNSLLETSGVFQTSTNRYKKYSLLKITSAILGVLLAIMLTKLWGIVGALLGFIIAEIVICGWSIPAETLKIVGLKKRDFWRDTVGKSFIIVLPEVFVGGIISKLNLGVLLQCILSAAGIFSTGIVVSYLFCLTQEEKRKVLQLIKTCLLR